MCVPWKENGKLWGGWKRTKMRYAKSIPKNVQRNQKESWIQTPQTKKECTKLSQWEKCSKEWKRKRKRNWGIRKEKKQEKNKVGTKLHSWHFDECTFLPSFNV